MPPLFSYLLGVLLSFTCHTVYGDLNRTDPADATLLSVVALCNWDECRQLEEQGPMAGADLLADNLASDYALCQVLDSHSLCLKGSAKKCRGNLRYDSYVRGLSRVMKRKNCSGVLANRFLSAEGAPSQVEATAAPSVAMHAFHGTSTTAF